MGVSDYGSAGQPFNNPSVSAWAASVASALNSSDVAVNTRIATSSAFIIVASSAAPATVKAAASYVCDGTADQTEINAALAALPATGGHVLAWGDFSISAPIVLTGNAVTLSGVGTGARTNASQSSIGTRFKVVSGFTGTEAVQVQPVAANPAHGVTLRDFSVDGGAIGTNIDGILFRAHTSNISHVHVGRMTGNGVRIKGYNSTDTPPNGWATYDTVVDRCISAFNTGAGVYLDEMAQDCHLMMSVIFNNTHGIRIGASSVQITGCHTYDNSTYNVWFDSSGSRSKIVNLKCEQAGQHGVFIDGTTLGTSDIQIVGSNFKNNGWSVDNTYDHIYFVGGGGSHSRPTIVGCNFTWTTGNKARYGINLNSSTAATFVNVQNNNFGAATHFSTGPLNMTAAMTGLVRDNQGYSGRDDSYVMVGARDGVKNMWFGGESRPGGMAVGDYWIHD